VHVPPPLQVRYWIQCGVHIGASDQVYVCWGRRLLCTPGLLFRGPQALILQLLADYAQVCAARVCCVCGRAGGAHRPLSAYQSAAPLALLCNASACTECTASLLLPRLRLLLPCT
jgi:hypothetical protein